MKKYKLLIIVSVILIIGTISFGAMFFPRTWAYKTAIEKVSNDKKMIEHFGVNIEGGAILFGWRIGGPPLRYRFSIPIHGEKLSGTIRVVARKLDGTWVIEDLKVYSSGKFIKKYFD